ncbi:MAG: hypothetical protein AB2A00_06380 [Myxococcota bacterium]
MGRRVVALVLGLVLLHSAVARAAHPSQQAPVFKKLLDYDRSLQSRKGAYVVLVVHTANVQVAQDIIAEFRKVGVAAISAPVAQLPQLIVRASAAYLVSDAVTPQVLDLCAQNKVLTLSDGDRFVGSGQVAVGLGAAADGRQEIVVHLGRMRAEGHELPASVLRLARVIR